MQGAGTLGHPDPMEVKGFYWPPLIPQRYHPNNANKSDPTSNKTTKPTSVTKLSNNQPNSFFGILVEGPRMEAEMFLVLQRPGLKLFLGWRVYIYY